jgi:opacity protein-like surface antigen
MKKRMYVLGVAALVVALLALSGVAQSAMWVGAELGGNFNNAHVNATVGNFSASAPLIIKPSVIGGVTLGYDFVNSGFGGFNYPSWMQYFSIATDLTYNRMDINEGTGARRILAPSSRLNGWEVAWTFLFMAHYGFLRDDVAPSGRINPYIGVGPAVVFSGAEFTLPTPTNLAVRGRTSSNFGTSATNVALVVEPGIRWVCMKNVSVDTAFRYRYAVPSWSDDYATLKVTLHQFAFLVRANYHF